MKPFELNFGALLLRFYLMMAVILVAGFTGQWWIGLFGLPIFISAMTGLRFGKERKSGRTVPIKQMETLKEEKRAVV